MSNQNDVATFLMDNRHARIDVTAWDGFPAQSMAMKYAEVSTSVPRLINDRVTKEGRAKKNAEKGQCSWCETIETVHTARLLQMQIDTILFSRLPDQTLERGKTQTGMQEDCRGAKMLLF